MRVPSPSTVVQGAARPLLIDIVQVRSLAGRAHRHDRHELVYVVRGAYRVEVEGRRTAGGERTWFAYPAGTDHRPELSGRGWCEVVVVQWTDGPGPGGTLRGEDRSGRVFAALQWLLDLQRGDRPADRQAAAQVLAALVHELGRGGRGGGYLLRVVEQYVADHRAERITPALIAQLVGLSRSHLLRRFAAEAGQPLMAYVRERRLQHARELLATGLTLAETARRCGFSSASHLARLHRARWGATARGRR